SADWLRSNTPRVGRSAAELGAARTARTQHRIAGVSRPKATSGNVPGPSVAILGSVQTTQTCGATCTTFRDRASHRRAIEFGSLLNLSIGLAAEEIWKIFLLTRLLSIVGKSA